MWGLNNKIKEEGNRLYEKARTEGKAFVKQVPAGLRQTGNKELNSFFK